MKPLGAFAQFAALMLEGDYSPVPIKVGEKRPLFDAWDRLRSAAVTPAEIKELCRNYPGLGLGVAGGFGGLVPIDVDTDDRDIVRAIRGALPPVEVAKRGQKGFTAFYWDPAGVIGGMKFRHPRIDGGWDMLLELLATGQSVLPPTPHPAIKRAFRWLTTATLFNTRVDELPIIGRRTLRRSRKRCSPGYRVRCFARRCGNLKRQLAPRPETGWMPMRARLLRAKCKSCPACHAVATRRFFTRRVGSANMSIMAFCRKRKFKSRLWRQRMRTATPAPRMVEQKKRLRRSKAASTRPRAIRFLILTQKPKQKHELKNMVRS